MNISEIKVPERDTLRVLQATKVTNDFACFCELHDAPGKIFPVKLISISNKKIKDWDDNDSLVIEGPQGTIVLHCHSNKGPKYLIRRATKDTKVCRVTFFTLNDGTARLAIERKERTVNQDGAERKPRVRVERNTSTEEAPGIDWSKLPRRPIQHSDETKSHFRKRIRIWTERCDNILCGVETFDPDSE